MADDTLRSLRFRKEREESWRQLESLLAQVDQRSAASLTDEEMVTIPGLYRAALSSLSVARATSLDQALIDYLEALCARAYFFVYGTRTSLLERVGRFFVRDWPAAVRAMWRETLASALLMAVGAATAFVLIGVDSDWFYSFMPEGMSQGRDPNATKEFLLQTLYERGSLQDMLSLFAAYLFTHNAQIAIFSFALGFAFGLPSAMLIAYNGMALGAMFAVYAPHGLAAEFGGWVFIHGMTELLAIVLAGAAGFRIGWSIAFPGQLSRLAAAEQAGRQGGVVMVGVVIMLFIAGLLEGFARQLIVVDWQRWTIALSSLALWLAYFYFPRWGTGRG